MKISGYLDERYEPPAPFIRVTVVSKGFQREVYRLTCVYAKMVLVKIG
jgi:hypothetical protein